MIRILGLITASWLLCSFCITGFEVAKCDYKNIAENKHFEKRLIWTESRGKTYAKSYANARGLYQITPQCLADYNRQHKTKFTHVEMHCPQKSRIVYLWYVSSLEKKAKHLNYKNKIVYVTNAYNMGPNYKYYNVDYLMEICPGSWANYIDDKKIYYFRYNGNLYAKVLHKNILKEVAQN